MRSYFAKLSARAAFTAGPHPAPAAPLFDPFEAAGPSMPPALPPVTAPAVPKISATVESISLPRVDSASPTVRPSASDIPEAPEIRSAPLPPVTHMWPSMRVESDSRLKNIAATPLEPSPVVRHETIQSLTPPAPEKEMRSRANELADRESTTEALSVGRRDDESLQEAALLLRRADAFMSKLIDRTAAPANAPEPEVEIRSVSPAQPQAAAPARLQPQPAPPPTPETDTGKTSLTIGRLTVEVVPPSPAPAASRPTVVVVRGSRGRRGSIPSARRFGLGQF